MTSWIDSAHEKTAFAVEFIDIEEAAAASDVMWEPYQLEYLNLGNEQLAIWHKARQVAWSFTSALDAIADAFLYPGNPHIFVSINQDEAKEKIRYVKNIYNAMDSMVRPVIERSSLTEVETADGSRFMSYPCRPPRGKPKSRIYLDEMAHYRRGLDREIYTASIPATTHGGGYIRIGSSPFGADGQFWEIMTGAIKEFAGFKRFTIPWWSVNMLCKDVDAAMVEAPGMPTEERLNKFARDRMITIFDNMYLEDFQQEYECAWVDESVAFISWELIKECQDENLLYWHAEGPEQASEKLREVQAAIEDGKIESVFTGGIDVGRTRNTTEFFLIGRTNTEHKPLRFSVTLDNVRFDRQEDCIAEIVKKLPIKSVLCDRNGIGMQLAENLESRTGKVKGVNFTNESKELWATDMRIAFERHNVILPIDRDISYQIHSIRKTKTGSGALNRYDTEGNEKHHADKFWALALAVHDAYLGLEINPKASIANYIAGGADKDKGRPGF